MRRALPAIGMTAAGVIMLLRFQTSPGGAIRVGASAGSPATGSTGATSSSTTTPSSDPGRGGFDGPDQGGFGGNEVPGTTPDPNAATAAGAADGTYDGTEVMTRFGPVKVQITIANGSLTDVQELEAPSDHERSVAINEQAAPILHDEAIQAQSARLDQVSGATITWGAYEQSLQAALDAAHK